MCGRRELGELSACRCLYADWNDLVKGKIADAREKRFAGMIFLVD